eukprot:565971-Prorocentrum_lima.AAC.1
MTSSLVGSEMCIRDRVTIVPSMMRGLSPLHPKHSPSIGDWFGDSCTGKAVSYTHLTLPTICSV